MESWIAIDHEGVGGSETWTSLPTFCDVQSQSGI
jgi:hypothetical protein